VWRDWSFTKLIVGLLSKQFIAWVATLCVLILILEHKVQFSQMIILCFMVIFGSITVIWMLSEALKKLISNAEAKFSASINANLNPTLNVSEVVKSIKEKS